LIAINKDRLFKTFQKDGRPYAKVFVEDCDEDVSTAVALLRFACEAPELLRNPRLDLLVSIESNLDLSSGMYAGNADLDTLDQIRWVYAPYQDAKRQGRIPEMDAKEMGEIITLIGERIRAFVENQAERVTANGSYDRLRDGDGWCMVKETGNDARGQMGRDGIEAFVSIVELPPLPDGVARWKYSLGRLSEWIPFPLDELYAYLNVVEGIDPKSTDRWGGSSLSGGSPKNTHSSLSPDQLHAAIETFLQKQALLH
jgi:hypothetical protein